MMGAALQLQGCRYGRLVAIRRTGTDKHGSAVWSFKCDCGESVELSGKDVYRGHTSSCGCLRRDLNTTHGDSNVDGRATRLYKVWQGMLKRCELPSMKAYKDYGGRGITVCPDWHNYSAFKAWALCNGYSDNLEIDRRDNNGNYEPRNCRFVTHKENANNRRDTILITAGGTTLSMAEWSRRMFGNRYRLRDLVRRGRDPRELIKLLSGIQS